MIQKQAYASRRLTAISKEAAGKIASSLVEDHNTGVSATMVLDSRGRLLARSRSRLFASSDELDSESMPALMDIPGHAATVFVRVSDRVDWSIIYGLIAGTVMPY